MNYLSFVSDDVHTAIVATVDDQETIFHSKQITYKSLAFLLPFSNCSRSGIPGSQLYSYVDPDPHYLSTIHIEPEQSGQHHPPPLGGQGACDTADY